MASHIYFLYQSVMFSLAINLFHHSSYRTLENIFRNGTIQGDKVKTCIFADTTVTDDWLNVGTVINTKMTCNDARPGFLRRNLLQTLKLQKLKLHTQKKPNRLFRNEILRYQQPMCLNVKIWILCIDWWHSLQNFIEVLKS